MFDTAEIAEAIKSVDNGEVKTLDVFICKEPDNLQQHVLTGIPRVDDIPTYVSQVENASMQAHLAAWQIGVCNSTLVNRIEADGMVRVESIVTEATQSACRGNAEALQVIWASPYQLSATHSSVVVNLDGVDQRLPRDQVYVRLSVQEARDMKPLSELTLIGSVLRQLFVVASAPGNSLGLDIALGIATGLSYSLTALEKAQVYRGLRSEEASEVDKECLKQLVQRDQIGAIRAIVDALRIDARPLVQMDELNSNSFRFKVGSRLEEVGGIRYPMKLYANALVESVNQDADVLDVLSRDAKAFLLMLGEIEGASALEPRAEERLYEIVYSDANDLSCIVEDGELHRASDGGEVEFNGTPLQLNSDRNTIDGNRFTHPIKPCQYPGIATTCVGRPVRIGVDGSVPCMIGLDKGTITQLLFWGVKHLPFINGNPEEDMLDCRKVEGQTVVSLLMAGKIGAKGTAFLLSQMVHGNVKLSADSKNSLAQAIARHNPARDGEMSYVVNGPMHTFAINRTNSVVIEGQQYVVFGDGLAGKVNLARGYYEISELAYVAPDKMVEHAGRTKLNRPVFR